MKLGGILDPILKILGKAASETAQKHLPGAKPKPKAKASHKAKPKAAAHEPGHSSRATVKKARAAARTTRRRG